MQKACTKAVHLVSITPIRKPVVREKRAMLSVDMGMDELLEKYFETKDFSDAQKRRLFKKAQELCNYDNKKEDCDAFSKPPSFL